MTFLELMKILLCDKIIFLYINDLAYQTFDLTCHAKDNNFDTFAKFDFFHLKRYLNYSLKLEPAKFASEWSVLS